MCPFLTYSWLWRSDRAAVGDVRGWRGHSDEVESDFSQWRLTGQRLEDGDGLLEGLGVLDLLHCPR